MIITGTITQEPKQVGTDTYTLTIIAEEGIQYLLTVNELTKNNMHLKRGRRIETTGLVYSNPTTGVAEISPHQLRVLSQKNCPSPLYKPKRSPRTKGPKRKQCPAQMAFAI